MSEGSVPALAGDSGTQHHGGTAAAQCAPACTGDSVSAEFQCPTGTTCQGKYCFH